LNQLFFNKCEIGNNVVLYNAIVAPNFKISDDKELRDKNNRAWRTNLIIY